MSVFHALLLMLGVLAAMVLVCLLVIWLEKELPGDQYDERQKIARGHAYRVSFWVGTVYYAIVMVYCINLVGNSRPPVEPYLLLFAGIVIQALVFHIYCLLTNSALPLSQKPFWAIFGYVFCGSVNLLRLTHTDTLPLTGTGSDGWLFLLSCVAFFSLAIFHLIRFFWQETE